MPVAKYGLDGIGFDDEYADDGGSTNSTSYSEIILKLHALMPADKLTRYSIGAIPALSVLKQELASTTLITVISVPLSSVPVS